MFDKSPLYYILISLIFLTMFGSIAMATFLVWLSAVPILIKAILTLLGVGIALLTVLLYTVSVD